MGVMLFPLGKTNYLIQDLNLDCHDNYLWELTVTVVIYKHVVARKIKLTRRFSLFCLLNK